MSVEVHARSEHARGAAAARRLRSRARRYLDELGIDDAELSILIVTDAAIRALNRRWRRKDQPTDVLSFPAAPEGSRSVLGDVVVSLDTARRVARAARRPVEAELDRYLAHGLLHLLGHDHLGAREARRMAAAEDALVGCGMIRTSLAQATARRTGRPRRRTGGRPPRTVGAKARPARGPGRRSGA